MCQKPKAGTVADLTIANSLVNLIRGDIQEHLPMKHIPLAGDVLGLRTTTSIDNGELIFLRNRDITSAIWHCVAHDGSILRFSPGDGSSNFSCVYFTVDAKALRGSASACCWTINTAAISMCGFPGWMLVDQRTSPWHGSSHLVHIRSR